MDGGEDREVRSDLECIYSGDGAWWPVDTKKTRVLASDDGDIELRVVFADDGEINRLTYEQLKSGKRIRRTSYPVQDRNCYTLTAGMTVQAQYHRPPKQGEDVGTSGYYDATITSVQRIPHGKGTGDCKCKFSLKWLPVSPEFLDEDALPLLPRGSTTIGLDTICSISDMEEEPHAKLEDWLERMEERRGKQRGKKARLAAQQVLPLAADAHPSPASLGMQDAAGALARLAQGPGPGPAGRLGRTGRLQLEEDPDWDEGIRSQRASPARALPRGAANNGSGAPGRGAAGRGAAAAAGRAQQPHQHRPIQGLTGSDDEGGGGGAGGGNVSDNSADTNNAVHVLTKGQPASVATGATGSKRQRPRKSTEPKHLAPSLLMEQGQQADFADDDDDVVITAITQAPTPSPLAPSSNGAAAARTPAAAVVTTTNTAGAAASPRREPQQQAAAAAAASPAPATAAAVAAGGVAGAVTASSPAAAAGKPGGPRTPASVQQRSPVVRAATAEAASEQAQGPVVAGAPSEAPGHSLQGHVQQLDAAAGAGPSAKEQAARLMPPPPARRPSAANGAQAGAAAGPPLPLAQQPSQQQRQAGDQGRGGPSAAAAAAARGAAVESHEGEQHQQPSALQGEGQQAQQGLLGAEAHEAGPPAAPTVQMFDHVLASIAVLADQDSQRLAREAQRLRASGNPDALGDLMLFLPLFLSLEDLGHLSYAISIGRCSISEQGIRSLQMALTMSAALRELPADGPSLHKHTCKHLAKRIANLGTGRTQSQLAGQHGAGRQAGGLGAWRLPQSILHNQPPTHEDEQEAQRHLAAMLQGCSPSLGQDVTVTAGGDDGGPGDEGGAGGPGGHGPGDHDEGRGDRPAGGAGGGGPGGSGARPGAQQPPPSGGGGAAPGPSGGAAGRGGSGPAAGTSGSATAQRQRDQRAGTVAAGASEPAAAAVAPTTEGIAAITTLLNTLSAQAHQQQARGAGGARAGALAGAPAGDMGAAAAVDTASLDPASLSTPQRQVVAEAKLIAERLLSDSLSLEVVAPLHPAALGAAGPTADAAGGAAAPGTAAAQSAPPPRQQGGAAPVPGPTAAANVLQAPAALPAAPAPSAQAPAAQAPAARPAPSKAPAAAPTSAAALAQQTSQKKLAQLLAKRGNDMFKERKYAEAVEAYTQCLVNDPDLHIARANRAATYVRLGMWPQVEDDCNVVLAKDPAYVKARVRRALARLELGRPEDSLQDCAKVLEQEPGNGECLGYKQRAEALLGARQAAAPMELDAGGDCPAAEGAVAEGEEEHKAEWAGEGEGDEEGGAGAEEEEAGAGPGGQPSSSRRHSMGTTPSRHQEDKGKKKKKKKRSLGASELAPSGPSVGGLGGKGAQLGSSTTVSQTPGKSHSASKTPSSASKRQKREGGPPVALLLLPQPGPGQLSSKKGSKGVGGR